MNSKHYRSARVAYSVVYLHENQGGSNYTHHPKACTTLESIMLFKDVSFFLEPVELVSLPRRLTGFFEAPPISDARLPPGDLETPQ